MDYDGGDAAHEDEAAAGLHVLAGLLGDEKLALDVDGEDFVDFGACDLVKVAKVFNAGVALLLVFIMSQREGGCQRGLGCLP